MLQKSDNRPSLFNRGEHFYPFEREVKNFLSRNLSGWYDTSSSDWDKIAPTNFFANDTEYTLEVAVPGMSKEDIRIDLDDQYVTISANKETKSEETDKTYFKTEFSSHSYHRQYSLPEDITRKDIVAKVENGILSITLPRVKAEAKESKRVNIKIN